MSETGRHEPMLCPDKLVPSRSPTCPHHDSCSRPLNFGRYCVDFPSGLKSSERKVNTLLLDRKASRLMDQTGHVESVEVFCSSGSSHNGPQSNRLNCKFHKVYYRYHKNDTRILKISLFRPTSAAVRLTSWDVLRKQNVGYNTCHVQEQ